MATDETWVPHFPDDLMPWIGGGYLRRDTEAEEKRLVRLFERVPNASYIAGLRSYHGPKDIAVLATIDQTERFGNLLHVSLSYSGRDPRWTDIKYVRHLFFPDTIDVMMVLPAAEDYVNIHEHTFHMQQTPERWKIR